MRLLVMYDLPINSKKLQQQYNKFHNLLLNFGFIMIQYSIYIKICINYDEIIKLEKKVELSAPKNGNIRMLSITEKQYENMKIISGEKSLQEIMASNEKVIEL